MFSRRAGVEMGKAGYLPLSVPYLGGNEEKYLVECVRTGWVSSVGPFVDRFEKAVSGYCGTEHAVAVSAGTTALHTALLALGVKEDEEVLVPTITFIATVNVVKYVRAHPVFMDCDDNLNIDPLKVREFCENMCVLRKGKLINRRTGRRVRAVIPVHALGFPADLEKIMDIADEFGLYVIEDAAESIGSKYIAGRYAGKHTGTIGHIGCYSFNGNKIITAGGGGMVVTSDGEYARTARYLSNQAKDAQVYFLHHNVGYNYRMTNLQAAVGLAQLEQLDGFIRTKRENFEYYRERIEKISGLRMITEPVYSFWNAWYYSVVFSGNKFPEVGEIIEALSKEDIQARPLWNLNHTQRPYIREQKYRIKKAVEYFNSVINVPCSIGIRPVDMDRVVAAIGFLLQKHKKNYHYMEKCSNKSKDSKRLIQVEKGMGA